jgi:hypothetical protein
VLPKAIRVEPLNSTLQERPPGANRFKGSAVITRSCNR